MLPLPPTLEQAHDADSQAVARTSSVWRPVLALAVLVFTLVIVGALVLSGGAEGDLPGTPAPTEEQAPSDGQR